MSGKTTRSSSTMHRLCRVLLWGLFLGVILFATLLPYTVRHALNRHVFPRLAGAGDGLQIRLAMPSLDYTGLTAVLSVSGSTNAPAFEAGSIRVGYTPAGLARRRIRGITIHGAVLYLEQTEDGWQPRGMAEPGGASGGASGRAPGGAGKPFPDLLVGHLSAPGTRVVFLEGDGRRQVSLDLEANDVRFGPNGGQLGLRLATTVAGAPLRLEYSVKIGADGIVLEFDPLRNKMPVIPALRDVVPNLPFDTEFRAHKLHLGRKANGELALRTANWAELILPAIGTNDAASTVAYAQIEVEGPPDALTGNMLARTEAVVGPDLPFKLGEARFHMPLQWPMPTNGCGGRLVVDNISFGDVTLGPLNLACNLDTQRVSAAGTCAVGRGGAATARIGGSARLEPGREAMEGRVELPLGSDGAPIDLRELLPAAPKGSLEGTVTAVFESCAGSNAVLGVELRADELRLPEQSLTLTGLETACRFDATEAPASARHQRLTVEELRLGSLVLREVEALYDLEADGSVFLESARAQCSGGGVEVHALRVVPGAKTFEVVLRGDRLRISELFAQLGLPAASGDGALSGRVPVRLEGGRPRFKDGFLFTTPGQPGVISFGDTDAIAGALAQGAGQNAQVALVGAALKAFSYEWVTVTVNSEEDILRLLMTISGRPERNIPFRYENKSGTYVVTSSRETGSRPPMVVNLNFRIPLDEIMKYTVDFGK